MDLSTTGVGGGPYTSTTRTIQSNLVDKYEFRTINYKTEMGTGISITRIRDLITQIKRINPDIVHYTGLQLSGFHMAVACKIAGVKNTVVTVRGFSGDAINFNFFKKVLLKYLLEPITLVLSKKVIGVSEYVVSRNVIKLLAKNKSIQIYNFPPNSTEVFIKNDVRNELEISENDILIVSVARITTDKGYNVLDEAILHFKEHSNLKFLIVGDGDYIETMKKKLHTQTKQKSVIFLGFRKDINKILSACDIFVLPTLHETLSVALLEASQAGLALIASNTGGVPEIVEDNYNGILVAPGSVDELISAIEKLYSDETLRKYFGENAKYKVGKKFSSMEIEQKLDLVYTSLLKK
ncbi:glycosyltransferase [Polaribacter gangjinensis]|nr:glycosyltransferase [Polaribacter gangjinensis]